MTDEQRKLFLVYGCFPRCLIHLTGSMTIEEFCDRYDKWFQDNYGMIKRDKVASVLADLGFRCVGLYQEYEIVREKFGAGINVIVLSRISLNKGATNKIDHSSVLEEISNSSFVLWTSSKSGWCGRLPDFARHDWELKGCSGLCIEKEG